MALIAQSSGLLEPLRQLVRDSKIPVWGTCAGLILLSDHVSNVKRGGQECIGGLNVQIKRNAFGRQVSARF